MLLFPQCANGKHTLTVIYVIHCVVTRVTEAANKPKKERVTTRRATSSSNFDKSPAFENNFDLADSTGYSLSPAPASYTSQQGQSQNRSGESICLVTCYSQLKVYQIKLAFYCWHSDHSNFSNLRSHKFICGQ